MKVMSIVIISLTFCLAILNIKVGAYVPTCLQDLENHFMEKVEEKVNLYEEDKKNGLKEIYERCKKMELKFSNEGDKNLKILFDNKRVSMFNSDKFYIPGTASAYFNLCFGCCKIYVPHYELELIFDYINGERKVYYANLYQVDNCWFIADFDLAVENRMNSLNLISKQYFKIPIDDYFKRFVNSKYKFAACIYKNNEPWDLSTEIKLHDKKLLFRYINVPNLINYSDIQN